ncbi:hypothetical protein, partial [Salmonella enterica]|uniref:hypothetical protein n=1 Tax=Salmonella enterica TaxID=28901 RepID=UPI001C996709
NVTPPRVMRLRVLRNGLWRRMNHLMAALRPHAGRPDKMLRVATRHRGIFCGGRAGVQTCFKKNPGALREPACSDAR